MDENVFDDLSGSDREKSALMFNIRMAKTKGELLDVLSGGHNPPAEDLVEYFPEQVEKLLHDLPDEEPPSP